MHMCKCTCIYIAPCVCHCIGVATVFAIRPLVLHEHEQLYNIAGVHCTCIHYNYRVCINVYMHFLWQCVFGEPEYVQCTCIYMYMYIHCRCQCCGHAFGITDVMFMYMYMYMYKFQIQVSTL